jgi:hypothetical protein
VLQIICWFLQCQSERLKVLSQILKSTSKLLQLSWRSVIDLLNLSPSDNMATPSASNLLTVQSEKEEEEL